MSERSDRPGFEVGTAVRAGATHEDELTDFVVTVSNGPSAGASWVIGGAEPCRTYVGTSEVCRIRLADPLVSRRHVALSVTGAGLAVDDLDSTNGTWVDTVRVGSAILRGGETITIGDTRLRVDTTGVPKPSRAPAMVRFGSMIGASVPMRRLYPLCQRIAASDVPVLIEGETGTGKEVLAESLHASSGRAGGPFVIFDCTTVAPNLLEAALFGHEKGAFTGAVTARPGVFELAHGGTLFIDEIGDLDISLQAKLLRALQGAQVQRVGGAKWIDTNVRIISATRRDLEKEIQEGRFRDDLYFRLVVARIELPALRDRRDDVPLLARSFWTKLGGREHELPPDLLAGREDYPWPGNVRELHNHVARRLALGDLADSLPPRAERATSGDIIDRVLAERQPFARARERVVFEFERRYTDQALAEHGGNVTKAAEASGIGRRYFYVIRSRSGGE
ncbi:MAG: sigma 54-dependent Fis family transcriptional regulator [Labilithrix sp.]|nr:sigma 54-dependent Fis family transcriptional regulator [Labilithrix sp.]